MATAVYTEQRTELRILDGTATPQYITIPFVQVGANFPVNRPRADQQVQMNRNKLDTYTHWIRGSDAKLLEPIPCTFTCWLDEQLARVVLAALSNPHHVTPWLVSTATFVTASGTGSSIIDGGGSSFAPPVFSDDPWHQRVHVEHRLDGAVTTVNSAVFRHEQCYFPPDLLQVQAGERVVLSATYWIYGAMLPATAFTTGTNRTPAVT